MLRNNIPDVYKRKSKETNAGLVYREVGILGWIGMRFCTDSTIINKSIFKYSYSCASFMYEIIFDKKKPDSIFFKGYNESSYMHLTRISNKVYRTGDTIQYWVITFEIGFNSLTIKEYMKKSYAQKADPNTFRFDKSENDPGKLSKYFIDNILAGQYKDGDQKIVFTNRLVSNDGFYDYYKVDGIDSVKTYDVVINFWDMVPQMDLVRFYNSEGWMMKQYEWEFEGKVLNLRRVEIIYTNAGDFDRGIAKKVVYSLEKE